ncbi:MAG: hypothetical protein ACTSQE_09185 [Candidatus Heimdallarchaeaceae archaeon]
MQKDDNGNLFLVDDYHIYFYEKDTKQINPLYYLISITIPKSNVNLFYIVIGGLIVAFAALGAGFLYTLRALLTKY